MIQHYLSRSLEESFKTARVALDTFLAVGVKIKSNKYRSRLHFYLGTSLEFFMDAGRLYY